MNELCEKCCIDVIMFVNEHVKLILREQLLIELHFGRFAGERVEFQMKSLEIRKVSAVCSAL